jgi:hypothetical protein
LQFFWGDARPCARVLVIKFLPRFHRLEATLAHPTIVNEISRLGAFWNTSASALAIACTEKGVLRSASAASTATSRRGSALDHGRRQPRHVRQWHLRRNGHRRRAEMTIMMVLLAPRCPFIFGRVTSVRSAANEITTANKSEHEHLASTDEHDD